MAQATILPFNLLRRTINDRMNPEDHTPVPSPCISLCKMSPDTGLCEGCLRTIDEIVAWSAADDAYKRGVWADIRRREAELGFD
jgi:predicted Fe-S protein YdhL (DUF1289 family)